MTDHYDAVVIGSGAGGGTLARTLAMSGKRILLLERGNFLPRELCNWQPLQVLNAGRYVSQDAWYDAAGNPSVLDVTCKAHDLDNLYVADASFLPSVGAVGPALTVMANAIRVGEHLVHRLR